MEEVQNNDVLKAVQRRFPVCNIIDARTYDGAEASKRCNDAPSKFDVSLGKKKFTVTICTGSFNVYVLKIEDKE